MLDGAGRGGAGLYCCAHAPRGTLLFNLNDVLPTPPRFTPTDSRRPPNAANALAAALVAALIGQLALAQPAPATSWAELRQAAANGATTLRIASGAAIDVPFEEGLELIGGVEGGVAVIGSGVCHRQVRAGGEGPRGGVGSTGRWSL
jgi:hypothetical protein